MPADITDLFREHGFNPVKKTAKEWASPCPACGGKDRCSLWPEDQEGRGYYWCRQCDTKGDGIQFLRDYAGMRYADACKRVGVAPVPNLKAPSLPAAKRTEAFQPVRGEQGHLDGVNLPVWRGRAAAFVSWATEHLVNTPVQMAWLAARGLDAAAVRRYRLGYNPGEKGNNCIIRPRDVWGLPPVAKENGQPKRLWLPRGIVIPQIILSPIGTPEVHRVRIRRLDADREQFRKDHKYHVVEGSGMDVLWLPCTQARHEGEGVVVVVESELDAMLLHSLAGDMVHCMASMTSNIRNLPGVIFEHLSNALCILVALDKDKAGKEGWSRWEATFPRARRWPVPSGKDPGEAFSNGEDLRLWLLAGIPKGLRMAMPSGCTLDVEPQEETCGGHKEGNPPEQSVLPVPPVLPVLPEPPPIVREFHAMWQRLPVTYSRFLDAAGNCVGFSWDYDYETTSREEVHRFLRFKDQHDDVCDWLALNPENVITAKNYLNLSQGDFKS